VTNPHISFCSQAKQIEGRIPQKNLNGCKADGIVDFLYVLTARLDAISDTIESREESHLTPLLKLERTIIEEIAHKFIDTWLAHQITKPMVNDEYEYQKGGLLFQWCSECSWESEPLRKEISHCPECGGAIADDCQLQFGGTTVVFKSSKNRFLFSDSNSLGKAVVYEADFPDTIAFMLRHGNFWS